MRNFLIILLLIPSFAYACLWINGTSINGGIIRRIDGRFESIQLRNAMRSNPKNKFEDMKHEYKVSDKDSNGELIAVELILKGNYLKGISDLIKREEENPGGYSTAANLGTAYELNGEDELALKWIKEGIKRNPKSHDGTEWLHQLILETKLKLKGNPNYLMNNRVLELPNKFSNDSKINISGTIYTVDEIHKAIFHQLKERVIFVKPKEAIVADLLFTGGIIVAHTEALEPAIKYLELSIEYGFLNSILIDQTINDYKRIINTTFYWHLFCEIILGITVLILSFKQKAILNQIKIKTGKSISESLYKMFVGSLIIFVAYYFLTVHSNLPF